MANKFLIKRSSVASKNPATTDLALGELALNTYDGNLFFKKSPSGTDAIVTVATLDGTQTLTNKTLTSPVLTTPSHTGLSTFTATTTANAVSITYTPTATSGAALFLTGKDSQGGTGYLDFIKVTNTTSGATNPSKSLRLNSTGNIEIVNSAYTSVILSLSDSGQLTVPSLIINGGSLTAGGNTGSTGQFLKSTGSGVAWATPGGSSLATLSDVVLTSPTTNQVLTFNGANWINAASNAQIASAVFASSAYDMGFVYDSSSITEDEGSVTGSNNYVYDLGILSFTGIISLSNLDQSVKTDYLGYSIIFGF